MSHKVIWAEGMFLQPQHFQQQDRYFEYLITQRPGAFEAHLWGISELTLDKQLLKHGQFAIQSCQGIFPDGTSFTMPQPDKVPLPLDLAIGTHDTEIFLALPLKRPGMPEVSEQASSAQACRYSLNRSEVYDTHSSSDLAVALYTGELNLSLLLANQEHAAYSKIAIAKIIEVRADRQVILADDFYPATINSQAVPQLASFMQELTGLLRVRADMLAERLTGASAGGIAEAADFMLLQIVNRYESLLMHLSQLCLIHPEILYRYLVQLLGELASFSDKRRPEAISAYQHLALHQSFIPLMQALRQALSQVLEEKAVAIKLSTEHPGTWVGVLADKKLLHHAQFILAVHANLPTQQLQQLFPAHLKIAPIEQLRNLVNRALPGIELQSLPVAPRQIPFHANYSYFTLNAQHPLWPQLEQSAGIAFHLSGDFPDIQLALWAIKE